MRKVILSGLLFGGLQLLGCNTEKATDLVLSPDPMICNSGQTKSSAVAPTSTQKLLSDLKVVTKQRQYQLQVVKPAAGFPLNEYFDLVVNVLTPVGQPLSYPVELELEAGMRAHSHGMNTLPKIKALGDGQFLIEQMLFHMPGEWNLEFKVKRGMMGDSADIDLEIWP